MASRAPRVLSALAVAVLCAADPAEAVLVIKGPSSFVSDRETAVMFAGEPLRIIAQWSGHPDKPRVVVLGGLEAGLLASIESVDGTFVDAGCLTFETAFLLIGRREPLDLSGGVVRIPLRATVNVYASLVPCGGSLAPGRYHVRWGTGSTDFASPGDRLPYFFSDRQTIDYRRAATLADHFDLHLARAGSLMMQDRWDAADAALAQALAVLPASAELYHLKALVAEERGDAASAVDCASRAVRLIEERADELLFERRAGKEIAERLRLYRAQRDRLRRAGGPQ